MQLCAAGPQEGRQLGTVHHVSMVPPAASSASPLAARVVPPVLASPRLSHAGASGGSMIAMTTTALITGANKGIGLETARQLAGRGMTVLLGARDVSRGTDAEGELHAEGHAARFIHLD